MSRVVAHLVCPACGRQPQIYRSQGARLETGGRKVVRHYRCECGARCRSVEVRQGVGRSVFEDVWTC